MAATPSSRVFIRATGEGNQVKCNDPPPLGTRQYNICIMHDIHSVMKKYFLICQSLFGRDVWCYKAASENKLLHPTTLVRYVGFEALRDLGVEARVQMYRSTSKATCSSCITSALITVFVLLVWTLSPAKISVIRRVTGWHEVSVWKLSLLSFHGRIISVACLVIWYT